MRFVYAISALLLLISCKIRHPFGGCPYDEVNISPEFLTPWGTVLVEEIEEIKGPYWGTLRWLDGEDVISVPKAGQAIEVEAELAIDLATARIHKYIQEPDRTAACEQDRVFIDAMLSFVRLDDGEVELAVPVTLYRDDSLGRFYGEMVFMPLDDFAPGLEPRVDHDEEAIVADLRWRLRDGALGAEFTFTGHTRDSPTTGHGEFKPVAEFIE